MCLSQLEIHTDLQRAYTCFSKKHISYIWKDIYSAKYLQKYHYLISLKKKKNLYKIHFYTSKGRQMLNYIHIVLIYYDKNYYKYCTKRKKKVLS